MKKYLVLLITIISFAFMTSCNAKTISLPEKTNHEKVTVYLFRGKGCSHCADFLTYFSSRYKKYEDYFEIVAYESWNNEDNQKLMLAIKEQLGEEANGSVPFIVIGSDYHLSGFGSKAGEEIINAALEAYQDKNYTDIVAKTSKSEKINPTKETLLEAAAAEDIIKLDETGEVKKGLSDGAIIGIIFGVIIIGFAGLVIFSRKDR